MSNTTNFTTDRRIKEIELAVQGEASSYTADYYIGTNIVFTLVPGTINSYTISENVLDGNILNVDGTLYCFAGQGDPSQNGIYSVSAIFPTTLVTYAPFSTYKKINNAITFIKRGSEAGNYFLSNTTDPYLSGTTNVFFSQRPTPNKADKVPNGLSYGDYPTGGEIDFPEGSVDVFEKFSINQTTPSQTLTLPNPSKTINQKIVYVENIGSTAFSMYGITVNPSEYIQLIFNGTSWVTASGNASSDAVTGQSSSIDDEIALFSGTTGKVIKRATKTGILKATSGVISSAVPGADYVAPNAPITGATKTKITYGSNGLVTAGTDATATDIVNTPAGNISATTVQSALNELDTEKAIDNTVVHLAGTETITGNKTLSGDTTISSLTANTRLELDSLKKVVSAVKKTADNQDFEASPATLKKPSRTPVVGVSDNIMRSDAVMPIDSKKQNRIIAVANEPEMLAIVEDEPNNILIDIGNTRVYRADEEVTYLLTALPSSNINNWTKESGFPKWVNTTVYATSNIFVKHLNKLYRSKIPVPVNTDPFTDISEVYWELSADATISDIRTIASRVAVLTSGVSVNPKYGTDNFQSSAGVFYTRTTRSETSINYTAQNPLSFTFYTRNGAVTGTLPTGLQTAFNSTFYDNAGVITDLGANGNVTIGIMYANPSVSGQFAFLIGQTLYTGPGAISQAKSEALLASLVIPVALQTWRELGRLVYRRDLVPNANFNDDTRFVWVTKGLAGGGTIQDASIAQKGIVQLSNLFNGTSQVLATTEKALTDGLSLKADKIPNSLSIANLPTGGVIGLATATVDIYEKFDITQTTAGQTITLPNPTIFTNEKIVYVTNFGTVPFTIYGVNLTINTQISLIYDSTKGWLVSGGFNYTNQTVTTTTANVTSWNSIVYLAATSNSIVLTLPPVSTSNVNQSIELKRTDATSNVVRIIPNAGQLIDGQTTAGGIYLYNENDAIIIRSNGSSASFIAADNRGNVGQQKSILRATATTAQTVNVGSPIVFDVLDSTTQGNKITINLSTGVVTLKAGSTYRCQGMPGLVNNSRVVCQWRNLSNNSLFGSRTIYYTPIDGASLAGASSIADGTITPLTDITIRLEYIASINNAATTFGASETIGTTLPYIYIEEVNTPANVVNTTDSLQAKFIGADTIQTATLNTVITFDQTVRGNIPLTNGVVTLTAGKTYKLEANISVTSSTNNGFGNTGYAWVDATTDTILDGFVICYGNGGTFFANKQNISVSGIYTPATNQTVKVVVKSIGTAGNQVVLKDSSSLSISQNGSTGVGNFVGATGTTDGLKGVVPAPLTGQQNLFLKADATWSRIVTSISVPIGSAAALSPITYPGCRIVVGYDSNGPDGNLQIRSNTGSALANVRITTLEEFNNGNPVKRLFSTLILTTFTSLPTGGAGINEGAIVRVTFDDGVCYSILLENRRNTLINIYLTENSF